MIQQLFFILDSDSYEVEVDTTKLKVVSIWRYVNNRTIKPEFINPLWLSQNTNYRTLKHEIDTRMMRQYGQSFDSPNELF